MNNIISFWLQEQLNDKEWWVFPDDFNADKAHQYLLEEFDSEIIWNHLNDLLVEYLRKTND